MIAVDLLSEIFILIVLGIYLKRNNVIDGQFWDMKKIELSAYMCYYISRRIFYGKIG